MVEENLTQANGIRSNGFESLSRDFVECALRRGEYSVRPSAIQDAKHFRGQERIEGIQAEFLQESRDQDARSCSRERGRETSLVLRINKERGKRTNNAGARAEERSKGRRDENCVNDVNEAIACEVISGSNERIIDVDFSS